MLAGAALLAALVAAPGMARGQQWVENRSYTEGIGIKLGSSMVFHPGLGVEAGYDSNVFYSDAGTTGAARLRIVPSIAFATLPPQRLEMGEGGLTGKKPSVEFRFGFAGVYEDWFGKSALLEKRRDFGINADLALILFPYGKFRLKIWDDFSRTIRAPNESMRNNYTTDHNVAGLGLHVVPGAAFDFGLDYRFNMNFYELESLRDAGNYQRHDIQFGLKWKFLPKTAFVFKGVVSPYLRAADTLDTGSYSFPLSNSVNLETSIGLVGLFTPRFGVAVMIGYGAGFFKTGDDFDSAVASGELRFFVTPMSAIRAGFVRDIRPSYFTNYYVRNEGYLSYEQLIAGKVLISAKVRLGYWKYSTLRETDGSVSAAFSQNPRVDWPVIKGIGFLEYRITDWIAINGTFVFTSSKTDSYIASSIVPGGYIRESYWKIEVFGGVRAMY
ncbi:MAG: hypothetical protein JRG91_06885 [Deltaproteobacteria bacterium]|nr:hypothetical protein [Deltaproteobacteria bacterium]